MIIIKWGKNARDPNQPSFVPYSLVGKVFGIDGSSVRRIVLKRFQEINNRRPMTRRQNL